MNVNRVKVWKESVVIPTYEVGEAERNPMFLEKRVYQGSSGTVYPYPVIEKISDIPVGKSYEALWLENEYVKIMILPELGGRVQIAWDKIRGRHFVYCNHVIKPALVGLAGPWISGGIEFNWPQHHRPSTFMPVDCMIEELPDGSATVWIGERERMFHQRCTVGFTLRPGRAVLEIAGRLSNPTPLPQTFLWWANPAVAVGDHYQSVFPPDVNAVFDHGKRDVSTFPIATGTYYKVDYSAGVDISRYKNIPVPTSYMAVKSDYNFVGGYENDARAGLLHVADHHIAPGKKQWTWGNGDFGFAWDRNLTDSDGPYIELMTGVYTDNQPDFAWLQPYEEKRFVQYFMPYRELGVVKNATVDLFLNLEKEGNNAVAKVFATSLQGNVTIVIKAAGREILSTTENLSPEKVFETSTPCDEPLEKLSIALTGANGRELLSWNGGKKAGFEIPSPAQAALDPKDVATCEELFLTGQHLEQYRHATYNPVDYYLEALQRDPSDIRNNNAMGCWLLRRGRFSEAEPYFRTAVKRQTQLNSNPYDGEPLYNLGLTLRYLDQMDEAYDSFFKACWNGAWQDAGYFSLSLIDCMRGDFEYALTHIDLSLARNGGSVLSRHLKTAILRHLGRKSEAVEYAHKAVTDDHFNFGCLWELSLLEGSQEWIEVMRTESHNYCEVAVDYINAGLYGEAIALLETAAVHCTSLSPMVYYYMGYAQTLAGSDATAIFAKASVTSPDYCFPNRLEALLALECATKVNPRDAKAFYYLGNLWYDKRQYPNAIRCWERSVEIDPEFPTARRNLALGYFNKMAMHTDAVAQLEKAFELDIRDARVLMELDQLYKRKNYPHSHRLAFLDKHRNLVELRDDLYLEYATLLNQLGHYEESKKMVDSRKFHPWEGGEGKVPAQYQIARTELAKKALAERRYAEAQKLIEECFVYPYNLGEGKLAGAQENDFNYWLGCAYEGLGDTERATTCFTLASQGLSMPTDTVFYNDQKPDKIFYQGLALLKLGRKQEADERFARLIDHGKSHIADHIRIDYFAVSLPDLLIWEDDLDRRNRVHCNYIAGLGYLGLNDREQALLHLLAAADEDNNHQGVQLHLKAIEL